MNCSSVPPTFLAVVALATAVQCARAQEQLELGAEGSATVAAVEAEGAAHPRPERVREYPSYEIPPDIRAELDLPPPPETVGTPERRCVPVPTVAPGEPPVIVRSGEFVIGGHLSALAADRGIKLWWAPLADASLDMELQVRGWRLGAPRDTARFEISHPTSTRDSETLEPLEEEAFFPGGVTFPSSGTWIVVGRTGRSWGCFLFSVPSQKDSGVNGRAKRAGN